MPAFTTGDGVRLNYTDDGDGRPVVLIAGHGGPLTAWAPVREPLLAAGYRVVAVDRRHTGASDFPAYGMRMARQGADLRELLSSLGLDGAVLVGHSMGASAIWAMLDAFGADGVAGLVFVDQTPKLINDASWQLGFYDLTWAALDEWVAGFGAEDTTGYPHEFARPLLRDHAVQDWRDLLPRIEVPTLAVGGRHSEVWPVEHAAYIAAEVPHGEAVILEASGHAPMLTEPDAFNEALSTFLAQWGEPPPRRLGQGNSPIHSAR